MKKLIISLVLSMPLFLTALPSFSTSTSALDNPMQRSNATTVVNVPKVGATYAYWYRWHRWHHWNRWHRWHHWHHWRR